MRQNGDIIGYVDKLQRSHSPVAGIRNSLGLLKVILYLTGQSTFWIFS